MKYKNLTIIGTSHIAKQSMRQVEEAIKKQKPEIIAIELDKKRYHALIHGGRRKIRLSDIRRIGFKGYLFNVIGAWVEKKLGKIVGVSPGSEMVTAINLARGYNSKICLIDQDIEITLRKFSKSFPFREKFNLFIDLVRGVFFGKREMKKMGFKDIDLTKVPSKKVIKALLERVKQRYPSLYKVLIEERNYVIADNLRHLIENYPDCNIVAVIGAGHEDEVLRLVKKVPEISYAFNIR